MTEDGQQLYASTATVTGGIATPGSGATITLWSSSANGESATIGARHKRLIVGVYSSAASAASGLQFDVSVDATNWINLTSFSVSATTLSMNYVSTAAPFLRARYVNSANVLTTWYAWVIGDQTERASQ